MTAKFGFIRQALMDFKIGNTYIRVRASVILRFTTPSFRIEIHLSQIMDLCLDPTDKGIACSFTKLLFDSDLSDIFDGGAKRAGSEYLIPLGSGCPCTTISCL